MTDPYLQSRQLLNLSFAQVIEAGKAHHIPSEDLATAIIQATNRNEAIQNLNRAGLSQAELAKLIGLTRQAILYITGPAERTKDHPGQSLDELRLEIWTQSLQEPSWWGPHGQLRQEPRLARLRQAGYRDHQVWKLTSRLGGFKADIVLTVAFGLEGPEAQRDWIEAKQTEGLTQIEIWNLVNQQAGAAEFSVITWSRYCQKLGIVEKQ